MNETRRDSELTDTDSFQIVLDTYRDQQSGFVFGTNPSGLEFDGQVTNEGQGGGFTLGSSLSGFNKNWDASWSVRTRTGDFGWSAEFAIPFATLRYDRDKAPVWGLNLQRNIRRRNEQAFWAPLPRQYDLYRVSRAGTLEGLEPPKQRNLKLSPYALGELTESPATGAPRDEDAEIGGELKWSVTPSLALDVTVNTDFAQVEVDEQQINLDRFNLFYPEKRPFFLENAGFFTLGTPGEVDLFFSRRIGIGPAGEVVPILGGARLSGKLAGAERRPAEHADARRPGRAGQQLRGSAGRRETCPTARAWERCSSTAAAPATMRRPATTTRPTAPTRAGASAAIGAIEGYVAKTSTPGLEGGDTAWNAQASYDAPAWLLSATYTEVGESFNPEVGFLERSGYRKPEALVMLKHRPKDFLGLLEVRPHVSYTGYYKPDGFQESGFLHMDSHFEWRSGWEVHTGVNVTREGVIRPFEIYPGVTVPPGTYDNAEVQVVAITNQGAPLSLNSRITVGGFFGGSRVSGTATLRGRVGGSFNAYADYSRNDVELPEGDFVTNLLKLRVSYSFTPRLYLQALLQWNDVTSNWSTNLRLGWLQTANTGLFVVYNENRDPTHGGVGLRDRSFTIKYSRMFDLLELRGSGLVLWHCTLTTSKFET